MKGKKYDYNLDIKEIAKRVRKQIKEKFPDITVSVTIRRFSGGQSMDMEIKKLPFIPYSFAFIDLIEQQQTIHPKTDHLIRTNQSMYNEAYTKLVDALKSMANAYNYDNSDPMTDYFDVNFYGPHPQLSWQFENEIKTKILNRVNSGEKITEKELSYTPPQKQHAKKAKQPQNPSVDETTITHNTTKNGIEVSFPKRPGFEVISKLKSLGFRWSRRQKIWYKKYSEPLWKQVNDYFASEQRQETPAQKEKPTEKPSDKRYIYRLHSRPFGIGTYPPENFVEWTDDGTRYGALVYSEKLPVERWEQFELIPITEIKEITGKKWKNTNNEYFTHIDIDHNEGTRSFRLTSHAKEDSEKYPENVLHTEVFRMIEKGRLVPLDQYKPMSVNNDLMLIEMEAQALELELQLLEL